MSEQASRPQPAPIARIRQAGEGDIAFISATWKQSFWRESPWANRLRWSVFAPHHDTVIRRLLSRCNALIACDPVAEEEIAGYIVFEHAAEPALHFAYVKPAFRKAGVARALFEATGLPSDLAGCIVTHPTYAWFSAPPFTSNGKTLKAGRPGLEAKFKATYDPYRWMEE